MVPSALPRLRSADRNAPGGTFGTCRVGCPRGTPAEAGPTPWRPFAGSDGVGARVVVGSLDGADGADGADGETDGGADVGAELGAGVRGVVRCGNDGLVRWLPPGLGLRRDGAGDEGTVPGPWWSGSMWNGVTVSTTREIRRCAAAGR